MAMTSQLQASPLQAASSLIASKHRMPKHRTVKSLWGIQSSIQPSIQLGTQLAIRLGLSLGITISGLAVFSQPSLSVEATSEEELYALCSKYPYNSQCEGYSLPIPLSSRSGKEGVCALSTGGMSVSDRCKVSIDGNIVSAYVEQGDEINALGGERRTAEFSIPTTAINQLFYAEGESINTGRVIANTLLWGVLGAALTKPDKVSQVQIEFFRDAAISSLETVENDAAGSFDSSASSFEEAEAGRENLGDEAIASSETDPAIASPAAGTDDSMSQEPSSPRVDSQFGNLTFETGRSDGQDMKNQLEGMTGLTPRISL